MTRIKNIGISEYDLYAKNSQITESKSNSVTRRKILQEKNIAIQPHCNPDWISDGFGLANKTFCFAALTL